MACLHPQESNITSFGLPVEFVDDASSQASHPLCWVNLLCLLGLGFDWLSQAFNTPFMFSLTFSTSMDSLESSAKTYVVSSNSRLLYVVSFFSLRSRRLVRYERLMQFQTHGFGVAQPLLNPTFPFSPLIVSLLFCSFSTFLARFQSSILFLLFACLASYHDYL